MNPNLTIQSSANTPLTFDAPPKIPQAIKEAFNGLLKSDWEKYDQTVAEHQEKLLNGIRQALALS